MSQYDALIDENTQIKKALIQSKTVIERKINDLETQIAINDDLRSQVEKLKLDNHELSIKVKQLSHERKQLETQFDNTTKNWKLLIEQKQREIEEIQSKLIPTFDQDMMRINIINELELPHRQQIEQKNKDIEGLNEKIYQLKRQIDIEVAKAETLAIEQQKQQKLDKERHQLDLIDLNHQIQELSKVIEDNKDKETIRRLRKELDEYKQKYQSCDDENEELRQERDKIREEKNEIMIKYARSIDNERNEKRQYKGESDKLNVRVRFLDEELRKEKIRREQLSTEFELLRTEKEQQNTDLRKKDDSIHYLQRKITEMEEEALETEQKMQDKLTRLYNDEHDRYLAERNKAITLQKDHDNMNKRYTDLNDDFKKLKDRYLKENTDSREQIKQLNDEVDKLQKQLSNQTREINEFERTAKIKQEQLIEIENENEAIKRRNRELQHRIQLIEINPLPPQISQTQIEPQIIIKEVQKTETKENNINNNTQDSKATNQTMQHISQENRELVDKIAKLQKKLKTANKKILELQMRNTILEKQLNLHHQSSHAQGIHSQSPLRQENQQQQQQQQQQQGNTNQFTDTSFRDPQQSATFYKQQQYPSSTQYPTQGGIRSQTYDDDLLNRVIMLTEAGTKQQYW